jgi:hypothetical protein
VCAITGSERQAWTAIQRPREFNVALKEIAEVSERSLAAGLRRMLARPVEEAAFARVAESNA